MRQYSLTSVALKMTVVHSVTYFLVGLLAFTLFDYAGKYADPVIANLMRQTSDPLVATGPLFQVVRGALFGLAFYPLREIVFARANGKKWLSWVFGAAFALLLLLATLGALAGLGGLPAPA